MKKLEEILKEKTSNYNQLNATSSNEKRKVGVKRIEEALATYVKFTDPAKVYSFDNIIEHASTVFGPYGGIYGEVFQDRNTNATILSKSKDGHAYFNSLGFTSRYIETVLSAIREKTLYISGAEGKTSRDGTTSLALISSTISKDFLLKRMVSSNNLFKVPSTVVKYTCAAIDNAFREILDKHKVLIYDSLKADYTSEKGFKYALNAISTTVDSNPMFVSAFKKLMLECKEKGIDLTSSYKVSFQEKYIGDVSSFELKLNTGIRMAAGSMTKNKASALLNRKSPVFILDGYIGDMCHAPFDKAFKRWLSALLKTKTKNGHYLFSKYNPEGMEPPIFLYNRGTDKMLRMFEDLEDYIRFHFKEPGTNNPIEEIVSPRFILLESEDISKPSYELFLKVFKDSVINLNGVRRHIIDEARKLIDPTDKTRQPGVPVTKEMNQVSISDLFPYQYLIDGPTKDTTEIMLPDIEFDKSVNDGMKFDSVTKCDIKPTEFGKLVSTVSFDGATLFVTPEDNSYNLTVKAIKDNLLIDISNYSRNTIEYEDVKRTLSMFNTATITPVFVYKTEDEFKSNFDLYQDAQGVFESVHNYGVMAGGNVTLLRYAEELYDIALTTIRKSYEESGIEPYATERYVKYAEAMLDSVYSSYVEVYTMLLQEKDIKYYIDKLQNEYKDKPLVSFDIVSGRWTDTILEATRSTVDIASSSLDILHDMLLLKSVKINNEKDVIEMQRDFHSLEDGIIVHSRTGLLIRETEEK